MTLLEHNFATASVTLALLVVVVVAVRQDLTQRRISNLLTATGFAAALALQSLVGGMTGFLNALAGAGVGLVCFLPLYFGKGMGAGDVKLMAAAGAFLGPFDAFIAAMFSLVAGAVLAIVILAWRAYRLRTAAAAHAARKERFPYAAAIAAGVVATMWLNGELEGLLP